MKDGVIMNVVVSIMTRVPIVSLKFRQVDFYYYY